MVENESEDKIQTEDSKYYFKPLWKEEPLLHISWVLVMLAGLIIIVDKIRMLF